MHHTLVPKNKDGKLEFDLVHQDYRGDVIASFTNLDDASHMCNRLNGGISKDVSILLDLMKAVELPEALRHWLTRRPVLGHISDMGLGAIMCELSDLLKKMNQQIDKERVNG